MSQWIRRADVQGNINDIAYLDGQFYIATAGAGVWWWNGAGWDPLIEGLPDLNVKAICINPDNRYYIKVACSNGEVYFWDLGSTQTKWLLDGNGLQYSGVKPTDISMVRDSKSGVYYTYMTTDGSGILRQTGLNGSWSICQPLPGEIKYWKSIGTFPSEYYGHIVVAGRLDQPLIYYMLGSFTSWYTATLSPAPSYGPITSIAFNKIDFLMASAENGGIYYSSNLANWYRVCTNPSNPYLKYTSIDYLDLGTDYCVVSGTNFGLYSLTISGSGSCTKNFTPFVNYQGAVSSIKIANTSFAMAGGPSKGPVSFSPCDETSNFVNERNGLRDYNVLDITPSTIYQYSDNTIFVSSGVSGIYKNINEIVSTSNTKRGYFYRMFSDYKTDGLVPVLKVKIPPEGYWEGGCINQKVIYGLTDGYGIAYSSDGGRSWAYKNGQYISTNERLLDRQTITDMVFNSASNFIVSAYGKNVYQTTDGGSNYSVLGTPEIPNKNVLCLAKSPVAEYPVFAGVRVDNSTKAGLYIYTSSAGWTALTQTNGLSVSEVALHPNYPSTPWIFIGTENSGVWYSTNNGSSFTQLAGGDIPTNARVYDLKLSPDFVTDRSILVAANDQQSTLKKGIFFTKQGYGWNWYNISTGLENDRVLSVAFSPRFSSSGQIFAGTALFGLFDSNLNPTTPPQVNFMRTSGFFNVPPNITSISVAPDNPKVVFATTMFDGVFKSRDGGDSFLPWSANLLYSNGTEQCPVPSTLSVAVTEELAYPQTIYVSENFSSGIPTSWSVWNGGTSWTWRADNPCSRSIGAPLSSPFAIIDSDCEGSSASQDDWLVTPAVDTSSAGKINLQFDHYFLYYPGYGNDIGKIKVCSSATGGSCSSPSGNWQTVFSFKDKNFGPEKFTIDLTSYKGTNFRVAFHYTGAYDWYWIVDNVNIFDPYARRIVVGTKDYGIYWANYYDDRPGWDSFYQSNKTSGTINEIRYGSMQEDMRATDTVSGDFRSYDFGETWIQETGASYGLTDISYGRGLTRGLNQFVWGCSSGKSMSLRSGVCNYQGRAWYRPVGGTWTQCSTTGLDTCEDFRSILQVGSSSILLGSIDMGGSGNWVGLYRSDNSCTSFKPSSEGLPQNPKVYAFYQNSGSDKYILAAVEDSDPAAPDYGGIYYSDSTSNGRAWVKTNLPSSTPSSWEVSSSSTGTTIYAGLSSDGIFSSLPSSIPITSPPTAYFEVQEEACVNTSVQFYDYSAGKVTSWYWNFGDGGYSYSQNPSHSYSSSGTFYPSLTATNSNGSDYYPNYLYGVSIVIRDELDVGNTLRVNKTGLPNEIQITWNDITGETGYRVYASNISSSYQTSFPNLPQNTTSYTTTANYIYFRVQPLSSSYICGDGIIGGSW